MPNRNVVALVAVVVLSVSVLAQPSRPSVPSSPSPPTGATGVSVNVTLAWASDPNAKKYEIYLATATPLPLVGTTNGTASYNLSSLAPGTTYLWQVIARGAANSSVPGPVWSFTTSSQASPPPPPPPPSPAVSRLKVMTWNIQHGLDAWDREAVDAQVGFMIDANADVIGLHEVSVETGRDLRALYKAKLEAATGVTWHAVWAPAPFAAQYNPEGNLVLSRLPIVSSSIAQFDVAPSDPGWLGTKRSAARVELRVNNRNLNVFFTHLDPMVSVRTLQLGQFLSWVSGFPAPRLVGGDFNMMPTEADYAHVSGFFDDGWTTLVERYQSAPGPDPGYTKNVRGIAPWTGQPGRIDYWFHEKASTTVQPTEIAVLQTLRSDHHAVLMWVHVQ
jgi:endonuclease/exonuclease/phosphatase family metal-dependent hydrolase